MICTGPSRSSSVALDDSVPPSIAMRASQFIAWAAAETSKGN